ncbi:MAG: hypothetical protein HYU39_02635 [Thaumarchaeota archaeon]|nr:hypothetical protein [Nitrososphaerota archaeon]
MEASAFSPGHITGFFSPHYASGHPLYSGSKGAGYSITRGVTTKVNAEPSKENRVTVKINGKKENRAPVSQEVVNQFLARTQENYELTVEHRVDVPVGAGFGSSAAAALSLALALNEALGLRLPSQEASQIAHCAEVLCGTGLGGVSGGYVGGFEVRTRTGAPGIGEIRRIDDCKGYVSIALCHGGLSTRQVLRDVNVRSRLAKEGSRLVDRFALTPSIDLFLKLSRQFAEASGLIPLTLKKVLSEADQSGFTCSMAMIGKTVFTLAKQEEASELVSIYRRHASSEGQIMVADVEDRGARLI